MQQISNEKRQKIIKALQEHGAKLPCPRCGSNFFSLLDGYFNQTIQESLKGMVLGGPSIPSVVVVCNQCGYLSQHALGALGLLPQEKTEGGHLR